MPKLTKAHQQRAGRKSAEKGGRVGNRAWGLSMLAKLLRTHHSKRTEAYEQAFGQRMGALKRERQQEEELLQRQRLGL